MAGNRHFIRTWTALPIAIVALSGTTQSVWAQDSEASGVMLEEIVVTATRREMSLHDVPMAISAIGQDQIERLGITNMESYFRSIPSLSLIDGGGYQKHMIIRGVAVSENPEDKAATGVYVDETLVSANFANLDPRIFDMERVEVLRGPQGTLYGGGSISGSIRYITNKPDASQFESNVALDLSQTSDAGSNHGLDAMVNIPLAEDTLALRLVGFSAETSGIYENPTFNLDKQAGFEQTGGRVSLRWTPTDNFSLTAMYMADELIQDGQPRSHTLDWENRLQTNLAQEYLTADAEVLSLTAEADLGWATLTSVTSQLDIFTIFQQDRSFLISAWGISDWEPLRLITYGGRDDTSLTEEIRLVSAPDAFGRFDWIAGLYYADREDWEEFRDCFAVDDDGDASLDVNYVDGSDRFTAARPGQGAVLPFGPNHVDPFGDQGDVSEGTYPECFYREYETNYKGETALYGELNYQFTERLTGTVGYRRTNDRKSYDILAQVAEPGDNPHAVTFFDEAPEYQDVHNNFMGNLSLLVNDNVTLYARAAEGFRLASGSLGVNLEPGCNKLAVDLLGELPGGVDSDSLWAYEAGAKMVSTDGRLAVNAGVFQNVWNDIQVGLVLSGEGCPWSQIFQNIASATGNGIEFDMAYRATDQLEVGFSGSYVDFSLDSAQPTLNALQGDRLPNHPDVTLHGYALYDFPVSAGWNGFVRGEMSYTGEIVANFIGDPNIPRPPTGDYTLAQVRGGIANDQWEIALYINNLFDTEGHSFRFEDWTGRIETFVLRPRTMGVNFRTRL